MVAGLNNLIAGPANLVLFDFDDTLVYGDTGARMILQLGKQRIWPLFLSVIVSPIALPLLLFSSSTRRFGASIYLWLSTVGMSQKKIDDCLERLAKKIANQPGQYHIGKTWKHLYDHMNAGDKVVIVTGCWESLAKRIVDLMGIKNIKIIGSQQKRWMGGYISHSHCYGKNKLTHLSKAGFYPPWAFAYSDSFSDIHLLRHADTACLIKPSRRTLTKVRQLLSTINVIN